MNSEQVIRAVLEQVGPPTPLPSRTADYVVGQIMRARSMLSKLFPSPEDQIDEVYVELIRTSRLPRIRQWWVHDARLRSVSLDPVRDMPTISTLGLTSVSRVDLKVRWPSGTGKLTIRDLAGRPVTIRQTVPFQHCTPLDRGSLAPRVRRFLNLANILQAYVV
ncbi:MAG: hypothetical protein ACOX5Q_09760 [Bacillota bacterium]|jgi:hypothetical protein|nr:hypothetical protein [Candidatus Fermentithermobacillaceae bacterium]